MGSSLLTRLTVFFFNQLIFHKGACSQASLLVDYDKSFFNELKVHCEMTFKFLTVNG